MEEQCWDLPGLSDGLDAKEWVLGALALGSVGSRKRGGLTRAGGDKRLPKALGPQLVGEAALKRGSWGWWREGPRWWLARPGEDRCVQSLGGAGVKSQDLAGKPGGVARGVLGRGVGISL